MCSSNLIPNRRGERMTPSVVGLDATGHLEVGSPARARLGTAPDRTIAEVKRRMGSPDRIRLGDRE